MLYPKPVHRLKYELLLFTSLSFARLKAGFFMRWARDPAEAAAVQRPPPRAGCWRLRLGLGSSPATNPML